MDVKSYCDSLWQDLTVWVAKICDIVRALVKMPSGEKEKVASSVNDLHNVVDNIDSRIRKLEKECPIDWGLTTILFRPMPPSIQEPAEVHS